ncbi:MAG TPA: HAD family hydrolase [Burkholderiaceae bacterium]|nr:HAD family hydrolase [Burkholderiaceae bacterium]
MTHLALFDLDHTLLSGDSDVLWCEYLMQHGLLDRAEFAPRNAEMARRYDEGSVTPQAYCEFYVSTLAGRSVVECAAWCQRFLDEEIMPRIAPAAHALVDKHRERGDRLVLTTATNRVITERTAQHLRIADLIATEVEVVDGHYSGRTRGVLNMREGKVRRLHAWLAEQGLPSESLADAVAYSDSRNDLPLLSAVGHPVAANPDAHLRAHALAQGWEIVELLSPAM